MSHPADNDCYDAELLEALLGGEEDPTTRSSAGAAIAEVPLQTPVASTGIGSPLFMIGGSLFSRYRGISSVQLRRVHSRLSSFSSLNYGTIYCPFTKQFIAVRSPHWEHLTSAGFGVTRRLQFGRSVVLLDSGKLWRLAKSLQKQQPQDQYKKEKVNREPMAGWCRSLQQTLGALLETLPVDDEDSLKQRVQEVLEGENVMGGGGRRIPLGFYDRIFAANDGAMLAAHSPKTSVSERVDFQQKAVSLGESYLRQVLAWHSAILQHRIKLPFRTDMTGVVNAMGTPSVVQSTGSKAGHLIEQFSSLASAPFCIPRSRMACLSVEYQPNIPLMQSVVDAVLRTSDMEHLFYCPVEHGADYNTLMDVVAYRVQRMECGDVQICDRIPILHLGLHAKSPDSAVVPALVVIGNAHLLSQRALARLLDQWTRNGAASITIGAGGRKADDESGIACPKDYSAGKGTKKGWEMLLQASDPLRVIAAGVPLFGSICALFVAYSGLVTNADGDNNGYRRPVPEEGNVVTCIESENAVVHVLEPVQGPIFSLEEPIVAALRRVAPVFQNQMDVVSRRKFVEEVCGALCRACAFSPEEEEEVNRYNQPQCVNSDDADEDSLLQLCESLEAVLSYPIGDGAPSLLSCEELLTNYPMLATARVRHNLIREYPLRVFVTKRNLTLCSAVLPRPWNTAMEPVGNSLSGKDVPSDEFNVTVTSSRQLARNNSEEDHDVLKRKHVLDVTLSRITHSKCADSDFSAQTWTKSQSSCQQQKLPVEQCYQPFFEPPVLLGSWSRTLLFCAPMLADVLTLQCMLLHAVRALARHAGTFSVIDVDIFHIDYVNYPAERRCRLFGVRLRFDPINESTDTTTDDCSVREAATEALHLALVKCAAKAQLFPLWTSSTQGERRITHQRALQDYAKVDGFVPLFTFESLDECVTTAHPNLVERRLFALAYTQRGPLRLTVGTPVIVLRDMSQIARGTFCRVVRFVSADAVKGLGASEAFLLRCYFEQQRGSAGVLPTIRPMRRLNETRVSFHESMSEETGGVMDEEVVVLPTVSLVGGYRSVHHYALPAFQLPLLAPCQWVAASTLLHPLFVHPDNLFEFVPHKIRSGAMTTLLSPSPPRPAHRTASFEFLYDAVFESSGVSVVAQGVENQVDEHRRCHSDTLPPSFVCCEVLTALSLFPAGQKC
uniref:Uncharacterized protein n=1 Tax=Trypanosoma congolense (strain IL3000) TaxID=1068625 RepID=G0UYN1_TRYCI|nr:conserved hypothetical protein [Trypanosoma congolense IL3000]